MSSPKRLGPNVPDWVAVGTLWIQFKDPKPIITTIAKSAYQTISTDMSKWIAAEIVASSWTQAVDGSLELWLKLEPCAVPLKDKWFLVGHDDIKELFQ